MLKQRAPLDRAIPSRLLLGLLFSSGVAILAHRRRSLSKSGVAGAMISGTTIFGMGGWSWGLSLIYFFVSSSLLSHFKEREKAATAADKFDKGSERDILQAAANGGMATLLSLAYGLTRSPQAKRVLKAGFAGALATANADTWATEIGVLSKQAPRLITTGKPVAPGTSGGITALGTGASMLGALTLGLFFWLCQGLRRSLLSLPLVALLSGIVGSLFDSLLGATVQAMYFCPACQKETEKRLHSCGTPTQFLRGLPWMNNDTVNFLATACGSLTGMSMATWLES
jgi:uncharacterized protein (TIGR00297 family)